MINQRIYFSVGVVLGLFLSSVCYSEQFNYPLSDRSQCVVSIKTHRYFIQCPSMGDFLTKKLDAYHQYDHLELDQLVAMADQLQQQSADFTRYLTALSIEFNSSLTKLEIKRVIEQLSDTVAKLKPGHSRAEYYLALGVGFNMLGQPVLALDWYLKGLVVDKNNVPLRLKTAQLLIELERIDQGLSYFINLLQEKDLDQHSQSIIWYELASVLFFQQDYAYALESLYRVFGGAVDGGGNGGGNGDASLGDILDFNSIKYYQLLGQLYIGLDQYPRAIQQYQAIYQFYQKRWVEHYPDHPLILEALNNLGTLYGAVGEFEPAQNYFDQAMLRVDQTVFNEHPIKALLWNNQAANLTAQGQHQKALELYQKLLVKSLADRGTAHVDSILCWSNMGANAYALADFQAAMRYQMLALEGFVQLYDEQHPQVAYSQNNLAATFLALGEYGKAKNYYEKAQQGFTQHYGPEHLQTAIANAGLGRVWFLMGQYKQAVSVLDNALKVFNSHLGQQHIYSQTTRQYLQKANTAWLIAMDQRP